MIVGSPERIPRSQALQEIPIRIEVSEEVGLFDLEKHSQLSPTQDRIERMERSSQNHIEEIRVTMKRRREC